jgi:hypothetical protein
MTTAALQQKYLQSVLTFRIHLVGRPRSRWLDEVYTDARRMGIRMWWRKALEREEWWKHLIEAKTMHEL